MTTDRVTIQRLLTVKEVAERLRYSPKQVRLWLRQKRLRGRKVGKSWRISPNALDDFLGNHDEE